MTILNTIKVDGIIFDLDGTLWDASAPCALAWNKILKERGYSNYLLNEDLIRSFSGLTIEKIFQQYFGFVPKDNQADLIKLYAKEESEVIKRNGGTLYPGVKDVLQTLKKSFKLFIVSNCLVGYIENFLAFNQFEDLFTDFESSGNMGKPKSENIQSIIERNNLKTPVYVGDTIWDYEACESKGVRFIYAAYGFGKVDDPLFVINNFKELLKLVLV